MTVVAFAEVSFAALLKPIMDEGFVERDKIISGDPTASIQGFNPPQMITSGFASAQVLDITNDDHPAAGNATMVYMQDDAWNQVPTDHLKICLLYTSPSQRDQRG